MSFFHEVKINRRRCTNCKRSENFRVTLFTSAHLLLLVHFPHFINVLEDPYRGSQLNIMHIVLQGKFVVNYSMFFQHFLCDFDMKIWNICTCISFIV